jgi:carbon monoxide dehydrogenase subunit G
MLLEVASVSEVGAPPLRAWEFIRDVARLGACIPNVSDIEAVDTDQRFSAVVSDKLGPFSLRVPVQIDVQSVRDEDPRRITAELTGNDSRGQARIKGTLEASLEPIEPGVGTRIALSMRMEVLGKLASLGAAPMRRRADEIFSRFARCVESELGAVCR